MQRFSSRDKATDSGQNSETQSWDSTDGNLNQTLYQLPLIDTDKKDHRYHFNNHHHHHHYGPYRYARKLTKKFAAPFFTHSNGRNSSVDGSNDFLPFYDATTGDDENLVVEPLSKNDCLPSVKITHSSSTNNNALSEYPSAHSVAFQHSRSNSSMTNSHSDSATSLRPMTLEPSADKMYTRSHSAVNLNSAIGRKLYELPVIKCTFDEDLMSSPMTPMSFSPSLRYSHTSNTPSSSELPSKRNSFGDSMLNSPRLIQRDSLGKVNTSSKSSDEAQGDLNPSSSQSKLKNLAYLQSSSQTQSQINLSHMTKYQRNTSETNASRLNSYASSSSPSSGNVIAPEIRKKFDDLNTMITTSIAKCITDVNDDNSKLLEEVRTKYEKLNGLNKQLESTIKDIHTYSDDVYSIKGNDLMKLKSSDLFTNLNDLNARLTVVKSNLKKDEETLNFFSKELLALEEVKKRNALTQKTRGNIILIIFGCLILVLIVRAFKHVFNFNLKFNTVRSYLNITGLTH